MKAFAILDGGGVKGAALAGCLKSAGEHGIIFQGFGGTSAGSIVALLAAVGYSPDELFTILVEETEFVHFLDDLDGKRLDQLFSFFDEAIPRQSFGAMLWWWLSIPWLWVRHRSTIHQLGRNLGIYNGKEFVAFLRRKVCEKLNIPLGDVTFADLVRINCKPLKIVASDLLGKKPYVFPDHSGLDRSVFDAVRASMAYPLVFTPLYIDDHPLIDGGMCSNLPIFLFEKERIARRIPVLAFDLMYPEPERTKKPYDFIEFARDLRDTALEATDHLLKELLDNWHLVPVVIDPAIRTLDFKLSKERRRSLFDRGAVSFASYYAAHLRPFEQPRNQLQQLQSDYGQPQLFQTILQTIAEQIEELTAAQHVRVSIMVPVLHEKRMAVYGYRTEGDSDWAIELPEGVGCTGAAFTEKVPFVADLREVRAHPEAWDMQPFQHLIPRELSSMISLPIFSLIKTSRNRVTSKEEERQVIGTLSIDTITALRDSGWVQLIEGEVGDNPEITDEVFGLLVAWADVLGKMMS